MGLATHASDEETQRPQNRSKNTRYENNVANMQFEYFLVVDLSSLSSDNMDSWFMDSGASKYFNGYCEVLSNLDEKETNLKILVGDNSSHPVKGFSSVSFHLDFEETIYL